jgi:hypothetical protein
MQITSQLGQIATQLMGAFHSNPLLIGGLMFVLIMSFIPNVGSCVGNIFANILGKSGEPARWGAATLIFLVLPIGAIALFLSLYAKVELGPLLNFGQ